MNSTTPYKNGTPRKVDASEIESGVQWVKAGADNKEQALLVAPRMLKRVCLALAVVLAIFVAFLGWSVWRVGAIEARANESRLQSAIRTTGERVGLIEHMKEQLTDEFKATTSHPSVGTHLEGVKAKLSSELRDAQKQHERAQADMMAQLETKPAAASSSAGKPLANPPHSIQKRMLREFADKATFLLWGAQEDFAKKWLESPLFGLELGTHIVEETDRVSDAYTEGRVDSATVIEWLRTNITSGRYPPPVSFLESLDEYLDHLTEEEYGIEWGQEYKSRLESKRRVAVEQQLKKRIKKIEVAMIEGFEDTPASTALFVGIHSMLVDLRLAHWLFPGDDPEMSDGIGAEFVKYAYLAQGSGEGGGPDDD